MNEKVFLKESVKPFIFIIISIIIKLIKYWNIIIIWEIKWN